MLPSIENIWNEMELRSLEAFYIIQTIQNQIQKCSRFSFRFNFELIGWNSIVVSTTKFVNSLKTLSLAYFLFISLDVFLFFLYTFSCNRIV